ncbi:MAG: hypothetical protein AAGB31_13575 [Bdellovibrio sp.]
MRKILFYLVCFFGVHAFAKDPSIRQVHIEGQDYSCRPSNIVVPCPTNELSTLLTFSGSFADSIGCSNDIQGKADTFSQDQTVAKKCFSGKRINDLSDGISQMMVSKQCTSQFNARCSEIYKCHEQDPTFGGYRELCGHLGSYLDFLRRVRGLPEALFTEQDGVNLCNELF